MIIRPFRSSDLDRIIEFKQESSKISFPACEIDSSFFRKNILKAEPGSILVAEDNANLVGYIYLKTKRTDTGIHGIIHHIFVDPEHRGRGLATQLMQKGEDYFRSKNLKSLRSTITITNEPSINMIKKFGYREKRIIFEKDLD